MSSDPSAMLAQFTGAPSAGPWTVRLPQPGEGFPQAPAPYTPPNPIPNLSAPDYSKTFQAIARAGIGIGAAARDIGEYRTQKAIGKEATRIAGREAYQLTQKGLKHASAVRAIAGAQGTTGAGSPLLAELNAIQTGTTEARTRIYQGNIEKYYADQKAKNAIYKAPADLLTALIAGSELFKERK
jgi:hypothetical protein